MTKKSSSGVDAQYRITSQGPTFGRNVVQQPGVEEMGPLPDDTNVCLDYRRTNFGVFSVCFLFFIFFSLLTSWALGSATGFVSFPSRFLLFE